LTIPNIPCIFNAINSGSSNRLPPLVLMTTSGSDTGYQWTCKHGPRRAIKRGRSTTECCFT